MRLFVGMPVPPHPGLTQMAAAINSGVPGARTVPDGSWHVTLRFLGEMEDAGPVVAAMRLRLSDARACPGQILGVGAFPDRRRARILWAGVVATGIDAVARRVVSATAGMGDPPERHDFVPHVTLARLRDPRDVSKFAAERAGTGFGPAPFDEVILYESVQGPGGTRHIPVETFRLKAQP